MKITIGHLYPEMLNLYGDTGNIATLKRRLDARGIDVEVKTFGIEEDIDFSNLDIVYIGAGGEREKLAICKRLLELKDSLTSYAENGGVILGICSGFEALGKYLKIGDTTVEGVGLLDAHTEYNDKKTVGNIIIKSDIAGDIVGFENHAGKVYTTCIPLGKVLSGVGSGDGVEGIVYKNVIGTYIHGPLLPKNPILADYIIKKALENQGNNDELTEIDDSFEIEAHNYAVGRFMNK